MDNYQYHEIVDIKHPKPNRVSIVQHKRLGDIISGFEEIATFEREVRLATEDGRPGKVFRQKTTNVTKSQGGKNPGTSTVSRQTKREMKPYNSQTNLRSNQRLAEVNPATRRFSRNDEVKKVTQTKRETKVTKDGQTTQKTTRTTRAGRGSNANLRK